MTINHKKNNNIKKIITSFSSINEKIHSLQQSSSDDFKDLYQLTKKTYGDVEIITQNTIKIFNQFDDELNDIFYKKIDNLKCDLDKFISLNKKNKIINIGSLEKLMTNFHILFVPLNNVKQNLLTLSFLITQLKFTNTNKSLSITDDIEKLRISTDKIKKGYTLIINKITDLRTDISETINIIRASSENLNQHEEFIKILNFDINSYKEIKNKVKEQYSLLKRNSKNYLDSIEIMLTNLQYQDIIHQKMQHVQQTYNQIVGELNFLNQLQDEKITQSKNFKYLPHLDLITRIQAKQLITTNKDYQNTINIIGKNLLIINDNLSSVKTINLDFIYYYLNYRKNTFNEFSKNNKLNSNFLHKLCNTETPVSVSANDINRSTVKITENFNSFKEAENNINEIIIEIEKKINLSGEKNNDVSSLIQQIKLAYQDIHKYNFKAESVLKNSNNISSKLNFHTSKSPIENNLEFILSINKTFNQFDDISPDLLQIENNNSRIINSLMSKIKSKTKELRYYTVFEDTILGINNELNNIIQLIGTNKAEQNHDYIEYFDNYTTNTEREVHDNVINNSKEITSNPKVKKTTENDVELF